MEKIFIPDKSPQAVILCPTRELALQVVGEIRKFAKFEENIKTVAVYGGESIERQIKALKGGAQIIVGTPGRVMDHMRRKTLKLQDISKVVLDEADEMLNMGFEEDINTILSEIPETRQTILFSATMSKRILEIANKYLKDPYKIKIKAKELTVDKIEQMSIELKQAMKDETLTRLIDINKPKKAVVFCNTKRKVDDLIDMLKQKGYRAESLHGDIRQEQRERIMKKFKKAVTDSEGIVKYNPETKTNARKQTGSFYTPRPIVESMVDESLKAYLKTKIKYDLEKVATEQTLRGIFVKELLEQINEDNKEEILDSIYIGLDIM